MSLSNSGPGVKGFVLCVGLSAGLACDAGEVIRAVSASRHTRPGAGAPLPPRADAGGAGGASPTDVEAVEEETLSRWNRVADVMLTSFNFHWSVYTQFPHPTFKGGTQEAYQAFAAVLLGFFDAGDDFDFVVRNHRSHARLTYILPSGQSGFETSFAQLATDFSADTSPVAAFAQIPPASRTRLAAYAERLNASP